MYKASQDAGQDAAQGANASAEEAGDHVTDVDFEEVKEDEKK